MSPRLLDGLLFWANLDGTPRDYTGNYSTSWEGGSSYVIDDELGRKVGQFNGNNRIVIGTTEFSYNHITYSCFFYH